MGREISLGDDGRSVEKNVAEEQPTSVVGSLEETSRQAQPKSVVGSLEETSRQNRFPPVGPPPPDVDEDTWWKMWEGREEGDGWAHIVEVARWSGCSGGR